ncbi:MAG: type II secretion system protein [Phycisphaerales bacterium JB040]
MLRRAFSLVEMIAAVTVVSIAGAVVFPSVSVLLDRLEDARVRRVESDRLHTALDQITRVVSEWPVENGALQGLTVTRDGGAITGLVCADAGGVRIDSGTVSIVDELGRDGWLCDGIVSFSLALLGPADDTPLATDEDCAGAVTLRVELETTSARAAGVVYIRQAGVSGGS